MIWVEVSVEISRHIVAGFVKVNQQRGVIGVVESHVSPAPVDDSGAIVWMPSDVGLAQVMMTELCRRARWEWLRTEVL